MNGRMSPPPQIRPSQLCSASVTHGDDVYGISGANHRADQWRIGMLLIRTWALDARGAPDSISYLPASLMNRCLLIKLTMPLSFSAADATGGLSVSDY